MSNTWYASAEDKHLVERFVTSFAKVERFLKKSLALSENERPSFSELLREYENRGRYPRLDTGLLKSVADFRNFCCHDRINPYQYAAVPTTPFLEQLEAVCENLENPLRIVPLFTKQVEVIDLDDSFFKVLEMISRLKYSQFPVYEGQEFRGLLTENGITRWLAQQAPELVIDLRDERVSKVISLEEGRPNFHFLSARSTMDEARTLFAEKELLEAILITPTAKCEDGIIGIITRWDVLTVASAAEAAA